MHKLPSVQNVISGTSQNRDRVVDLIRITSLLIVIFSHATMLLSVKTSSGYELKNLLDYSDKYHWFTWIFQVLPLFFFAGGVSLLGSWEKFSSNNQQNSKGLWLWLKARRLSRPLVYYLPISALILILVRIFNPYDLKEQVSFIAYQLLWFIGVYTICISFIPFLAKIKTKKDLVFVLGLCLLLIVFLDYLGFGWGIKSLHMLNMIIVWLVPIIMGTFWYKEWLPQGSRAGLIILLLLGLAYFLINKKLYDFPLISVSGYRSNLTPPTLILALYSMVQVLIIKIVSKFLRKICEFPKIWWLVSIGNLGSMTIYLWHMPVLLITLLLSIKSKFIIFSPDQSYFWDKKLIFLGIFAVLLIIVFLILMPLENKKIIFWDNTVKNQTRLRNFIGGWLVVLAGFSLIVSCTLTFSVTKLITLWAPMGLLLIVCKLFQKNVKFYAGEKTV